ncbi:hypothetical protein AMS68_001181 [Peltaster fructicola]|uniref:FAD-binding FR-type domain-containing protein n=1 Tax=Peltaster fructicola TaxID=286661 RepID=A0A6H0XLR2_9PEZI|nr:hypothetical protein AMS68_001181 [Peltaster fructicola]
MGIVAATVYYTKAVRSSEDQEDLNRLAAGYYTSGVVGLIVVSALVSNLNHLATYVKLKNGGVAKAASQRLRRALVGIPVGFFLVLPHWLFVAAAFIALNVGLIDWQMDWTNQAALGSRCGWIALCNLCLVVFLGLKNTPLSPLAGQTYRDLNFLHRICGYITVIEVILHGALFSSGLFKVHAVSTLQTGSTYAGAAAGIAMLILAITASWFFRRRFYEAFYVLHVLLVFVIIITMGLHQGDIQEKALIIVIISAGIWALDILIRTAKWLYYGRHGYCTLTPLAYGATKVSMSRSMVARPGSHTQLWIPSIGLLEQHPFSLLQNDPVELVVAARGGFTKRLYEAATKKPGLRCRAMLGGPYGRPPSLQNFDRVLLVAGGSGVTFAMGMAREWLHSESGQDSSKSLHFVWVVRSRHQFLWFLPSLERLRAHPRIVLTLHVTGDQTVELADPVLEGEAKSPTFSDISMLSNQDLVHDLEKNATTDKDLVPTVSDLSARRNSYTHLLPDFHHGRPVVDQLLQHAMAGSSPNDRILITGSGPDQLLTDLRASTGHVINVAGPTVLLHLEAYEW